jgi:hypothetical protein
MRFHPGIHPWVAVLRRSHSLLSVTTSQTGDDEMTAIPILLAVAAVVYVMVRRLVGEPLQAKRLVVLPVVLAVWGAVNLTNVLHPAVALDIAFLVVMGAVGVVAGMVRGLTVQIFARDGHLWYRYRPLTVVVWVALVVARVGIGAVGHVMGVHSAALTGSMLLTFGLSLLAEAAVVGSRALATGTPFAPSRRALRTSVGANRM